MFFLFFVFFYKLECTGGELIFILKIWKESSIRPFLAHSAGGQETFFYLTVALVDWPKTARVEERYHDKQCPTGQGFLF